MVDMNARMYSQKNVSYCYYSLLNEYRRLCYGIASANVSKVLCSLFVVAVLFVMVPVIWHGNTTSSSKLATQTLVSDGLISNNGGSDRKAPTSSRRVRIFCWVMTQLKNHATKAKAVRNTWAKRCDGVIFISSADDPDLPAVNSQTHDGRRYLWGKTKFGFRYSYEHHFNDYDWFFKADDDTYAVMENMQYMLTNYSADQPIFFGGHFRRFIENGYMSGGAGYVLSREAVRRLVEDGMNGKKCNSRNPHVAEDVEVAKCLQTVGVVPGDSRDAQKRGRFFPFTPAKHVSPSFRQERELQWYWNTLYYPEKEGLECCSDSAISFHYVQPDKMYELEYLIYVLRPHTGFG